MPWRSRRAVPSYPSQTKRDIGKSAESTGCRLGVGNWLAERELCLWRTQVLVLALATNPNSIANHVVCREPGAIQIVVVAGNGPVPARSHCQEALTGRPSVVVGSKLDPAA